MTPKHIIQKQALLFDLPEEDYYVVDEEGTGETDTVHEDDQRDDGDNPISREQG